MLPVYLNKLNPRLKCKCTINMGFHTDTLILNLWVVQWLVQNIYAPGWLELLFYMICDNTTSSRFLVTPSILSHFKSGVWKRSSMVDCREQWLSGNVLLSGSQGIVSMNDNSHKWPFFEG